MKLINREYYTEKIKNSLDKGCVIALTGQRRVGKSFVLRELRNWLETSPNNNVIFIDKERAEFDNISDFSELNSYVNENLKIDLKNYLLIDEVQEIDSFEKSIRNFQNDERCSIVITGSNAQMLSGELATILSGRYLEYHIQSLSYNEFLKFHKLNDCEKSLKLFLNNGGLPHLFRLGLDNPDLIQEYLESIYNTIILKDVVTRHNIRNVTFLENLTSYISDNIGKLFSANNISNFMKSQKFDISANIVQNYLNYLAQAYIINPVKRYDIHGKKLLESNEKYYFEDLGLRNVLAGANRGADMEKVLENVVYLQAKILGYKINVGQFKGKEIDFVLTKGQDIIYVQVTYLLSSAETIDREFGNLKLIKDNYPKYVISLDPYYEEMQIDGIRHLPLRTFLTNGFN